MTNVFIAVLSWGFFILSFIHFLDVRFLKNKAYELMLRIEEQKCIIQKIRPHIQPHIQPNIEKTLFKELGKDKFTILVDKRPKFPYKEIYDSSYDYITYYVTGSKINIFFFYSSIWTF